MTTRRTLSLLFIAGLSVSTSALADITLPADADPSYDPYAVPDALSLEAFDRYAQQDAPEVAEITWIVPPPEGRHMHHKACTPEQQQVKWIVPPEDGEHPLYNPTCHANISFSNQDAAMGGIAEYDPFAEPVIWNEHGKVQFIEERHLPFMTAQDSVTLDTIEVTAGEGVTPLSEHEAWLLTQALTSLHERGAEGSVEAEVIADLLAN